MGKLSQSDGSDTFPHCYNQHHAMKSVCGWFIVMPGSSAEQLTHSNSPRHESCSAAAWGPGRASCCPRCSGGRYNRPRLIIFLVVQHQWTATQCLKHGSAVNTGPALDCWPISHVGMKNNVSLLMFLANSHLWFQARVRNMKCIFMHTVKTFICILGYNKSIV